MYNLCKGKVKKIITERNGLQEILVEVIDQDYKAWVFTDFTEIVTVGDDVVLNTTAVDLNLGTGGYHFVVGPLPAIAKKNELGHIMKLRYTPWQHSVLTVEEPDSPHHNIIKNGSSLDQLPVIIGSLHSMIPAVIAGLKSQGINNIIYLMTDGASLPIYISNLVYQLTQIGWLQKTITVGQAFGGDLEAVNIYSGLIAGKTVCKAEAIVVAMGPGIVGTGTQYGNTAIEVGQIINAVNTLNGKPIVVPRINFSDNRFRHLGISHHTLTALGNVALSSATLVLPKIEKDKMDIIKKQIKETPGMEKHQLIIQNGDSGFDLLNKTNIKVTTMGRNMDEEREFFLAASAAGEYVGCLKKKRK